MKIIIYRRLIMLAVKSSLQLNQPSNFDRLLCFHKSIHTRPSKLYFQFIQKKDSTNRQSQFSSRRIRQSQIRKSETLFSNCSLFQAKRAKIRQIYERNHSSGWLQKILSKKCYNLNQQQLIHQQAEKMMKVSYYQNSTRRNHRKQQVNMAIERKVTCKGIKFQTEVKQQRKTLKKINNRRRNQNMRLTQPSENQLKKKQIIIKEFTNEIDINLSPWVNQYSQ